MHIISYNFLRLRFLIAHQLTQGFRIKSGSNLQKPLVPINETRLISRLSWRTFVTNIISPDKNIQEKKK